MSDLDSMIETLQRRVKDDFSVFSKREVEFILKELQNNQSLKSNQTISLNSSSLSNGGEHHG